MRRSMAPRRPISLVLTVALCCAASALLAGCGGGGGGDIASDTSARAAVSPEARAAVLRILPTVGRAAAAQAPSDPGTACESFVRFDDGYEAVVRVAPGAAPTGRILGPDAGLPAAYRLGGDGHADVTYTGGATERLAF
jgi:hypothetical protein